MVKSLQWVQHPMDCQCGRCATACIALEMTEVAETYDPALACIADDRVALLQLDIQSLTRQLAKSKFDFGEAISTCHDRDMQINSLNRQLEVAVKTLEGIKDHEHCKHGLSMQTANEYIAGYVNGCRFMSSIASKGLNEMEEVK